MWPNPQFPADSGTFTEEILNGKLHFLCSALLQNKDLEIQKSAKGNTIVVIDKDAYKQKMKAITSDHSKFENS